MDVPSPLLSGPPRPEDDESWQKLLQETMQRHNDGRPGTSGRSILWQSMPINPCSACEQVWRQPHTPGAALPRGAAPRRLSERHRQKTVETGGHRRPGIRRRWRGCPVPQGLRNPPQMARGAVQFTIALLLEAGSLSTTTHTGLRTNLAASRCCLPPQRPSPVVRAMPWFQ